MNPIRYLYIPKLPEDAAILDKVCSQFQKKAFVSDAVLAVAVENGEQVMRYLRKYSTLNLGITWIEMDKLPPGYGTYSRIMDDFDVYISASMNIHEHTLIELAYDKGKDIISAYWEDIFEDMPINPEKLEVRKAISKLVKNLATRFPMDQYEWILFHQGLGESCAFFYYIKAYREKINRKLLVLAFDPSRESLLSECPYIDQLALVDCAVYAYISVYLSEKFNIKDFLLLHFLPCSTKLLDKPAEIYPAIIPKVRDFLELDPNTPLERYPVNISQSKIDTATNKFKELGLKQGKTVFLVMDGVSFGNEFLNERYQFFVRLANTIKSHGYDVVIKGDHEIIEGYPFAFFYPWESTVFAGLCGHIVSIATGIPFAIGAFSQSSCINIHMFRQSVDDPSIRNSYDFWHLDNVPMLRTFGKKYWLYSLIENHELMIDIIFDPKVTFTTYTDPVWNDETIEKIVANL